VRVLVIGSGAREHALCWALSRNAAVDRLYAAPGNAGTAELATAVPISPEDVDGLVEFARARSIDLTVVGPEGPLVAGIVDELGSHGVAVFGPSRAASQIEGSKSWAKRLCATHGIPVAAGERFTDAPHALSYLASMDPPFVVKADGLAGGKGVTVTEERDEAVRAIEECLVRRSFGAAGAAVVIEEFLTGSEVSALALTDGRHVVPLALAQDYKRANEGDTGPNTGGMGAYSPVPFIDAGTESFIVQEILTATVRAMEAEGIRYRGVLYAGLMLTAAGPKVLEFNCRAGDPETQVILPRLVSSLGELLLACLEGNLSDYRMHWRPEACVGVVLASGGYPGPFAVGRRIRGLDDVAGMEGVEVFHAGTAIRDGTVVTSGGRVLTVTALGGDLDAARRRAYEACSRISFEGMVLRTDIAAGARPAGSGGPDSGAETVGPSSKGAR
jgi:phosphoribosylamine---glycine ligase